MQPDLQLLDVVTEHAIEWTNVSRRLTAFGLISALEEVRARPTVFVFVFVFVKISSFRVLAFPLFLR
jgi:hypothetical protein